MAILDLKSNLSQWRKPTTVESGEKKKLSESPVKAVYSTSTDLTKQSDIKINKVDNSTSIQVPGAKKIDYKLFSINAKRNRGIPVISTLFGDTILTKVSEYKEQRVREINKVSEFVKITPRGIQHISTIEVLKTILKEKVSLYKDQFPINILKLSLYKDQLPIDILKLSLYKDQIPAIIDKLSLYKDQIPALLDKISLYRDQLPPILNKLSLYKQFLIDNKNSIYDTRTEIIRLLRYPYTLEIYANKRMPVVNGFDDLRSGAKGFIINQKEFETAFLGISGNTYTYPTTVRGGRLVDGTQIKGALQWPLRVTFRNGDLGNTTYNRTVYTSTKPYTSTTGITGDTLEKYFKTAGTDGSAKDILYKSFNLRDSSFNTGLVLFNQPLILTGIQRKDFVKTGFYPWETWKFDDGFIRGGVVTSTQRAIVDVLRLGKWFASVKGLLFVARQAGLQASAPITEADPLVGKRAGNGALTLISSLANTATQHLGLRFRKDAVPFVPRTTYSGVMFGPETDNGRGVTVVNQIIENNRLYKQYQSIIKGVPSVPNISDILGGPQSVYGFGVTRNKRAVNSTGPFTYFNKVGDDFYETDTVGNYSDKNIYSINGLTFTNLRERTYDQYGYYKLSSYSKIGGIQSIYKLDNNFDSLNSSWFTYNYLLIGDRAEKVKNSKIIYNFLMNDSGGALNGDVEFSSWIPQNKILQNYNNYNQHQRPKLRVPDYGQRNKDLRDPVTGEFMNVYSNIGSLEMIDPIWEVNQQEADSIDDFVKFMFHDLNTNERFRFRAYIENVSEDFNPNWQEVKILGRADSPYIYQGFERTLSVSFKAAALSRGDLMLMWDQLERLARTTVPEYIGSAKMKGPLIKFTLGNWFINTPAFIRSLSYTVDNETPWEINLENSKLYDEDAANEDGVGELPTIVSVQLSMQIFGEVRPESNQSKSDLIATPDGVSDGYHYNAGDLYPLGKDGIRGLRQTERFGNKVLEDIIRRKKLKKKFQPKPVKPKTKKDDKSGGGGSIVDNNRKKPTLNLGSGFQIEKVDSTFVKTTGPRPYIDRPVEFLQGDFGGGGTSGNW